MTSEKNLTLEVVQVLFRHGARTYTQLEAMIPMPEYIDESLIEDYDYQQLTNIGKAQAHNLGCELRKRYDSFLGESYHPRHVFACSSDFDRTKMSLQLVLAGLYPPSPKQTWNSNLNWMPIPTHYVPREFDVILQPFRKRTYQALLTEACHSKEAEQFIFGMKKEDEFLKEKGINVLEIFKFNGCMGVFNVLHVLKTAKSTLPSWYTEDFLQIMKQHVINYLDLMSSTAEMKKLNCGPLIKKWIENMNLDGNSKVPKKIYLYSGHELNIAAFVRSHGVQKQFQYPDYTNAVVLEKHRDSENHVYVRLLARTEINGKFMPLKIRDYEEFCPIEEYLKLVENIIPTDEEIEIMIQDEKIDLKNLVRSDYVPLSRESLGKTLPV